MLAVVCSLLNDTITFQMLLIHFLHLSDFQSTNIGAV